MLFVVIDYLFLNRITSRNKKLCETVSGKTLQGNGNVLIPCYPSGVVYDLFECLSSHLDSINCTIPMYFISPVADMSLGYSNILAEW